MVGNKPTPLVGLADLASECGVKEIYVKDESQRVGTQAFKVAGGTFAMINVMCKKLGI